MAEGVAVYLATQAGLCAAQAGAQELWNMRPRNIDRLIEECVKQGKEGWGELKVREVRKALDVLIKLRTVSDSASKKEIEEAREIFLNIYHWEDSSGRLGPVKKCDIIAEACLWLAWNASFLVAGDERADNFYKKHVARAYELNPKLAREALPDSFEALGFEKRSQSLLDEWESRKSKALGRRFVRKAQRHVWLGNGMMYGAAPAQVAASAAGIAASMILLPMDGGAVSLPIMGASTAAGLTSSKTYAKGRTLAATTPEMLKERQLEKLRQKYEPQLDELCRTWARYLLGHIEALEEERWRGSAQNPENGPHGCGYSSIWQAVRGRRGYARVENIL